MFIGTNRALIARNRKRSVPITDWILANGAPQAGTSYVWKDERTWVDGNTWKDN